MSSMDIDIATEQAANRYVGRCRLCAMAGAVYLVVLCAWPFSATTLLANPHEAAPDRAMAQGVDAFERGDMEQAALMWQRAARDYAATGQRQAQSVALTHLARAYIALGHHDRAAEALQLALHRAKVAGAARQMALVLADLGQMAVVRQDLGQAATWLSEALAQAHELGDAGLVAQTLYQQGNLFWQQQRPRDALAAYHESATVAIQASQLGMAARALAHAARVAIQEQQSQTALAWLGEAMDTLQQVPASHETAYDLLLIGRLYQQLADADATLLLKALAAFQHALNMAQELQDQRALAYAWGYLGHLYEKEGRNQDALVLTRRAVTAAQQVQAPESLYQWEWQIGRLLHALGRADAAIATYARALKTVQSIQATLQQGHSGLHASFRQVIGPLYFQYVDLLLQKATALEATATGAASAAYAADLQQVRTTIEQFKTSELRDYFGDACVDAARPKTTTLDRVALDAAILYPILLEDRTELLLSLPTGIKRVTVAEPGARFERLTQSFRSALQAQDPQRYLYHAKRLYDLLIRPIETDLQAGQTLVWVPDGALRLLPLAALYDGEQFLIEKHALAVTPSLTLTDPHPLPRDTASALAAGMSEAVGDFPPLPHVRDELQSIHQLYGGTVLLNQDFSPTRLAQTVDQGQFSIVHIASHGEFAADPAKSFLLTSKGKLTLTQLAKTVGQLRFRDHPLELLTLSACETAQGDDRTALGLAGVAIQAGARSALATLWRVADAATAILMQRFYEHLHTPGTSRARALQQAQLALLHDPTYASPVFWAPFLLINNWL
jgi:CHAT domain-containing protein